MARHASDIKPSFTLLLPPAGARLDAARTGGRAADGEVDQPAWRAFADGDRQARRERRRWTPAAVACRPGGCAGDGLAAVGPEPRWQREPGRTPGLDTRRH